MSVPHRPPATNKVTVEEYLRRERDADQRHEYLDGEVFAMAGESGPHADISTNVVGLLHAQLKGKPCRVRTKDTKVRSGPDRPHGSSTKGLYCYPDVVVICGEPVYHDEREDVVLNPKVIVEVLSPATEAFVRGEKFIRLRNWNKSLEHYVIISQDQPLVEVYQRRDGATWSFQPVEGLPATAILAAIDCVLPLADVYDRVEFPAGDVGDSGCV